MRGDIVIVDFPFSDASRAKRRPALVVSADGVLSVNTIIALITSSTQRIADTRLVVDPVVATGSVLVAVSSVACESLFSLHQRLLIKRIGSPLSGDDVAD
jgi:mRNA interferase MazF